MAIHKDHLDDSAGEHQTREATKTANEANQAGKSCPDGNNERDRDSVWYEEIAKKRMPTPPKDKKLAGKEESVSGDNNSNYRVKSLAYEACRHLKY